MCPTAGSYRLWQKRVLKALAPLTRLNSCQLSQQLCGWRKLGTLPLLLLLSYGVQAAFLGETRQFAAWFRRLRIVPRLSFLRAGWAAGRETLASEIEAGCPAATSLPSGSQCQDKP